VSARQTPGDGQRLTRLLERAKGYCLKLERAALDFTCFEKIQEKTYRLPDLQPDMATDRFGRMMYSYSTPRITYDAHSYVYDYQFVRKGEREIERRTLIEQDGRKKKEDDAALATQNIRVENALFGPIGLVGDHVQAQHDYKIVGEETMAGKSVAIIDAVPKPSLDRARCFGRIWVREDDGSVVKISWDQSSVGNFQIIQAKARELGAAPQLTSVTEYGFEKNGLRFPSKDTTEEAYVKNGKRFVQSLTTILYKDYKFFTVETEIRY
jgi:hypothetical protein